MKANHPAGGCLLESSLTTVQFFSSISVLIQVSHQFYPPQPARTNAECLSHQLIKFAMHHSGTGSCLKTWRFSKGNFLNWTTALFTIDVHDHDFFFRSQWSCNVNGPIDPSAGTRWVGCVRLVDVAHQCGQTPIYPPNKWENAVSVFASKNALQHCL